MKQDAELPQETRIYHGLSVVIAMIYFCLTGMLMVAISGDNRLVGIILCAICGLFAILFLWGWLRHRKDEPIILNRNHIYFVSENKHLAWEKIGRCYINNKVKITPLTSRRGKVKSDRCLVIEFLKGGNYQYDISDYFVRSSRLKKLVDCYCGRPIFDASVGTGQIKMMWLKLALLVAFALLAFCVLSLSVTGRI